MKFSHRRRLKNRIIFMILVFLAFVSGIKFNSMFSRKVVVVDQVDINKYENDFSEVSRLLSQNTMAIYGIADTITNSWIKSLAAGQESTSQLEQVFSKMENNGSKEALVNKNKKIEEGMRALKSCPFKYREAYKVLEEVYTNYCQFYKFTLNPSGSLIIYSKKISELEGDLAKSFSRLNLYCPKTVEAPKETREVNLVMASPVVDEKSKETSRNPSISAGKFENFLGRSIEEVEKTMGEPQTEAWARNTNDFQREYNYNGQKVVVYYRNDLVTGLSN